MLRRHSGPSIAAATLAVFAVFTLDVAAQDASGVVPAQQVVPAQPVVPGANADVATTPTTQRLVPPVTDAGNIAQQAVTPAPAPTVAVPEATVPVLAQTPDPAAPPAAAPATPLADLPAASSSPPAAAAPVSQPMPPSLSEAVAVEPAPAEAAQPEGLLETFLPEFAGIPGSTLPHDLSPIGMFLAADWVVKGVMMSLAFASLVTWTVWIAKTLQLAGAKARASRGIRAIIAARTLDAALSVLENRGGTVAAMVRVANTEVRLSDAAIDHAGGDGVKERVGSALGRIEVQAGRNISKGTGVLATIGSTSPFVGLFGTVWGIMNSFIGISESQTTNLAVVAPGIAEALLATAIGLVAAIPAVIIYNVFARSVTAYRQSLADAAAGIERLVSRDLDFRKIPVEGRNPKIKLVTE